MDTQYFSESGEFLHYGIDNLPDGTTIMYDSGHSAMLLDRVGGAMVGDYTNNNNLAYELRSYGVTHDMQSFSDFEDRAAGHRDETETFHAKENGKVVPAPTEVGNYTEVDKTTGMVRVGDESQDIKNEKASPESVEFNDRDYTEPNKRKGNVHHHTTDEDSKQRYDTDKEDYVHTQNERDYIDGESNQPSVGDRIKYKKNAYRHHNVVTHTAKNGTRTIHFYSNHTYGANSTTILSLDF